MQKIINGYTWVLDSSFCPEQWLIYKDDKQVAYVRERWSRLIVCCPDSCGEIVLDLGVNEHKQEVMSFKDEIIKAIGEWIAKNKV